MGGEERGSEGEKAAVKGERGWEWVDGLWGLQVGLTLHIPLDENVTCQFVFRHLLQSKSGNLVIFTMWSKVYGQPNMTSPSKTTVIDPLL